MNFHVKSIGRSGDRDYSSVPESIRNKPIFIGWKLQPQEREGGKPKKPPHSIRTGAPASINDPGARGTYTEAIEGARRFNLDGIGVVLEKGCGLVGVDLDHCLDAQGNPEPWTEDALMWRETYTEVSPSGRGVRMLALGELDRAYVSNTAGVELYGAGRYLTLTGQRLEGFPSEILPAPETLETLKARVRQFEAKRPSGPTGEDQTRGEPPVSTPSVASETKPETFFGRVNREALANLDAWVPELFPTAQSQAGTGGYRTPSADLGRTDLEEDLSITPQGAKWWGVHDMGDAREGRRSPIDLVQEFGEAAGVRARDARGAAL